MTIKSTLGNLVRNLSFIFFKLLWSISSQKKHLLNVTKEHELVFTHFGDIPRSLFINRLLINYNRTFEYDLLMRFMELVKDDFVILDVGANVGLYSLLAGKYGNVNGHTYAFEPQSNTFKNLKENIKLNNLTNSISAYNYACSDHDQMIRLENNNSTAFHDYNDMFTHISGAVDEGDVQAVRLDGFIANEGIEKIDFVKIDIEGAELLCLKGATKMLKEHKPILFFEGYEKNCERFGYSLMELLEFIRSYDYKIKQVNSETWLAF